MTAVISSMRGREQRERERDRDRDRQTNRQTDKQTEQTDACHMRLRYTATDICLRNVFGITETELHYETCLSKDYMPKKIGDRSFALSSM